MQQNSDREILMSLLFTLTYSDNIADDIDKTLQLLGIEIEWDDLDHLYHIWKDQGAKSLWALKEDMKNKAATPLPDPVGNDQIVLDKVLVDLRARAEFGKEKYGTYLRINNGRNAAIDAYQEALDLTMYLAQLIMELED